ncbi:ATP-dependent endonuclease [Bradyrhizobium sp. th.b2]|uniref:ATP-dependent nuclease n=1 Tax=Bradyrhizobium sp. th-b2 TaxID=172088 RepID=UPI00041FA53C|nr:AAA family ATPase [Bradyrhizobium sp. th.b2]
MIESISLKFTERAEPLVVPSQGVTIFVGPNNSGKSLVLREFEAAFGSNGTLNTKLFGDYELEWPEEPQIEADVEKLRKKAPDGIVVENIYVGRFRPNGDLEASQVNKSSLFDQFKAREKRWIASQFLKYFQVRLDGRTRFDLTNDRQTGDLANPPVNLLAHLFQDDTLRKEIRDIIFDAFGVYFVVDPLQGGILRIRLSNAAPGREEQSLGKDARDFHRSATYIKDASDGVQAFVGILTAVMSGDFRSILIDEPEAFLHPPLARKLGYQLATTAAKRSGSLMASTHSPDFLIGCLQGSAQVRVVRLEYSNGKSKGQAVDADALRKFFKAPLIRSANVISGLFHDGVVVTESDNDRAFYSEIYYRLAERETGYPSLLFVNAQNKQTIRDIIEPLRAFGVPAAAIVDIDILKDGGSTWTGWLKAANFPSAMTGSLGVLRGDLHRRFIDANVDMKADGGVEGLKGSDRDAVNELFDTLDQFGVFVTRNGEIESWLRHLNVPGKKADWSVAMLERLGDDSTKPEYVHPTAGDVWDFMRQIVAWVRNSDRKGMASTS